MKCWLIQYQYDIYLHSMIFASDYDTLSKHILRGTCFLNTFSWLICYDWSKPTGGFSKRQHHLKTALLLDFWKPLTCQVNLPTIFKTMSVNF